MKYFFAGIGLAALAGFLAYWDAKVKAELQAESIAKQLVARCKQ